MRTNPRRRTSAGKVRLVTGTAEAVWVHAPASRRSGIDRKPRERYAADLPLTERHRVVLRRVGVDPTPAATIARACELNPSQTRSALYALADRGLVERVAYQGWRRIA